MGNAKFLTSKMMTQPSPPAHGWKRALLIGWLGWTAYSALYAVVLSLQVGLVFIYALNGSLVSHYLMALFSIPAWFWSRRVMAKWRWWAQLAGHLVGSAIYAVAWYWSFVELFRLMFGQEILEQAQLLNIPYWLMLEAMTVYAVFVGIFYIWRYQRQLREREKAEADLRLRAKQMELTVLKAQLNPHFLFNTLNSINALVGSDPEGARQVLARLAEVLRYSLESDRRALVPLAEELHFVETYLEIEKARFGRRLQIHLEIEDSARPLLVPPMILQPLAENAVKHGIAPKEESGEVRLRVCRRENFLEIDIADNGVGASSWHAGQLPNNGTGLRNTDLRLRKMFGEECGLQVSNGESGFQVKFRVPIATGLVD